MTVNEYLSKDFIKLDESLLRSNVSERPTHVEQWDSQKKNFRFPVKKLIRNIFLGKEGFEFQTLSIYKFNWQHSDWL